MVEVKFCKGITDMLHKTSFTQDTYTSFDFLYKRFAENVFPESLVRERGITEEKNTTFYICCELHQNLRNDFGLNFKKMKPQST